jgi:hypothetical protein
VPSLDTNFTSKLAFLFVVSPARNAKDGNVLGTYFGSRNSLWY